MRDQNPEAQHDALEAAGCERIFIEHASGKLATRPELDKAMLIAERAGDQLVVTKLDRLGRSLGHLIELSTLLQACGVDLVVLDQGIDTSTAVGRLFFSDHRRQRRVRPRADARAHDGRSGRRQSPRAHRRAEAEALGPADQARSGGVRPSGLHRR